MTADDIAYAIWLAYVLEAADDQRAETRNAGGR
jgi:hypothetical protein